MLVAVSGVQLETPHNRHWPPTSDEPQNTAVVPHASLRWPAASVLVPICVLRSDTSVTGTILLQDEASATWSGGGMQESKFSHHTTP